MSWKLGYNGIWNVREITMAWKPKPMKAHCPQCKAMDIFVSSRDIIAFFLDVGNVGEDDICRKTRWTVG